VALHLQNNPLDTDLFATICLFLAEWASFVIVSIKWNVCWGIVMFKTTKIAANIVFLLSLIVLPEHFCTASENAANCASQMNVLSSSAYALIQSTIDRATGSMIREIETAAALNEGQGTDWITIDLVQDQTHQGKAPPIPGFMLNSMARRAFRVKMVEVLGANRPKSEYPKLERMYFSENEEYRGKAATLVAHTIIRVQRRDLFTVLEGFIRTMNHPALGNKVLKMDVLK